MLDKLVLIKVQQHCGALLVPKLVVRKTSK